MEGARQAKGEETHIETNDEWKSRTNLFFVESLSQSDTHHRNDRIYAFGKKKNNKKKKMKTR